MTVLQPIYTEANTKPAWQLDWAITVFWRQPPFTTDWLYDLRSALEPDGIRILAHQFAHQDRSQFLVSTLPSVKPVDVMQRLKGRLQHLVRDRWPKALRRNYDLHSIGSTRREKVEAYVASQLEHHGVETDEVVQKRGNHPDERGGGVMPLLKDLQIINPEVNLGRFRFSAHARFRCNLHLVFVHEHRYQEQRLELLHAVRQMIRKASLAKQHLLSRLGLLPDHIHLVRGFDPSESPIELALSYMNNIAFVHQMQEVLMKSCYVGTIGEYDLGAIASDSWLLRE